MAGFARPFCSWCRLELAFGTRELRSICENESTAEVTFGSAVAPMIKRRLADVNAATSVDDLIAGNPRYLNIKGRSCLVVNLCDDVCIVFEANHPVNPRTESGAIDWSTVNRIKVTAIGNVNADS